MSPPMNFADATGKAITDHITMAVMNHPLVNAIPDTEGILELYSALDEKDSSYGVGCHTTTNKN